MLLEVLQIQVKDAFTKQLPTMVGKIFEIVRSRLAKNELLELDKRQLPSNLWYGQPLAKCLFFKFSSPWNQGRVHLT